MCLTSAQFEEIQPTGNGKRFLGPWANIFADEIAQIFPSCPLKFQRNFIRKQISRKRAMFVRLTASCKFKGTIYTVPF
jgi:hypothetical protein